MVKRVSSFSLLLRSGIRSLKKGWAQFLSIVTIGAIAVTLFVGLLANAESLEKRVSSVYEEGNLASLWVTTNQTFEEDEMNIRSFLGENDALDKRLYIPASVGNSDIYLAVYSGSPEISKPYGESTLNVDFASKKYFLFDNALKKRQSGSVSTGYSIGDNIDISIDVSSYNLSQYSSFLETYLKEGSKNLLKQDKITISSKITGFMNYPENIAKSTYNSSVTLMGEETLKEAISAFLDLHILPEKKDELISLVKSLFNLGDSFVGNQYLISLSSSSSSEIQTKIEDYYGQNEAKGSLKILAQRSDMPFYSTVDNDVTQARQFTFVFPFVFFLVAILVILTTISQHVLQERTQIGTMKAIGLSKRKIYLHYCSLTFLLVGLGTLLGEIIGPLLIPKILGNKYAILYSLPPMTYTFPALYGILTAVVFLFISVLVTFLVCHKEVSLKPVDSMRPKKPSSLLKTMRGEGKANVSALSIKMAFRNIRLNLGKSIMVIVGVMGCTALLLCGFGIEDTIYHGIDNDLLNLRNSDISITFSHAMSREDAVNDFIALSGVDYVEPVISNKSLIYRSNGPQMNSRIYIVPETSRCYKITFGQNEVAISKKVARNTKSKVGDTISFSFEGKTYFAKVGVIYEAFAYHGVMAHEDASFFKDIVSFSYSGAQVYLKEGVSPQEVNEQIQAKAYVLSSQTTADWNDYIGDVLSGVLTMTNAVKVFAILLALVVLYNLSLMNFRERTRDIATLKVLGFKRKEIALSLLFESMSLTFIGMIIGMFFGHPFLYLVMGTNIVDLVEYLYFIEPLSFLYAFLISFVTAFLVNLFFSLKTRKVQMVESLKSVE